MESQPGYKRPPMDVVDGPAYEYDYREDDDNYFEQPGKLFRLQTPEQQERIFQNTANEMEGVTLEVK
ncbi:hypothetical protein NL501_31165, partial [Klebsiella pneumoniae]|nr:hypothetical protein [Klebsiella pneumoniae]